jgi:hypothetical protein
MHEEYSLAVVVGVFRSGGGDCLRDYLILFDFFRLYVVGGVVLVGISL